MNASLTGFFNNPPDVEGDVGPNDYVEYVNTSWSVYDKTGVVRAGWPKSNAAIWTGFNTGFGPTCRDDFSGDPIVLYDRLADRWFLSEFAIGSNSGPYVQCIAISQTNDPTGAYYRYAYDFTSIGFQDYPHFGVWPDGYYASWNIFTSPIGSFVGRLAGAFNRTKLLAGDSTAELVTFNKGTTPASTLMPTDMEGSAPPVAGTPNFFWDRDDPNNTLELWKFTVNYAGGSTFTGPTAVPVAAFDASMCGGSSNCIPQPPTVSPHTVDGLDPLSGRINNRAVYRRFATHESIVVNHTVDENSADHAGVRWYELRNPNGAVSVFDSGTYAPDSDHRWMGNVNMDAKGNIAIGYSVSSSTTSPAIRYAGRLTTDTPGTMGQGEGVLQAGGGSFWRGGFGFGSSSRWGDYSAMQVDPSDDCTFWFVHEYMAADTDRNWQDRIGAFKFPTCSVPTAASVTSLGATRAKAGTVVRWRTATEANVLGFHVWRSTNAKTWRRVNLALVQAKASGKTRGAAYRFVDRTARKGGFVNYRLQLVDLSGKRSWYTIGALATG